MTELTAHRFFEATKHPSRIRHAGVMDWTNRPAPFKVYQERPGIPLPSPSRSRVPALEAIAPSRFEPSGTGPSFEDLSRMLVYGAGVTHLLPDERPVHSFRTYASAGALYPVEVYVACADLPGLRAGVYHFAPNEPAVVRLHEGDRRSFVARASGLEPAVRSAPVVLILTGIPWRTAWKYTERGYRHLFWDAGMIVANMLALAAAAGQPARLILGFADREIESLLGLDGRSEFPLALLAVGSGTPVEPSDDPPEAVSFPTGPLSRRVIEYPMITEVNDAGRLETPQAVAAWRTMGAALPHPTVREMDGLPSEPPPDDLETVIRRRGSARVFAGGAISRPVLEDVLTTATRGIPTDYGPEGSRLVEPFLIANQVNGLEPGAYVFRDGGFSLLREGNFRDQAALLSLQQRLAADAGATHFLTADLGEVMGTLGDRGYRAAELEAGTVGGKMYLAAYAHRLGATGLTFFDDPVTEFFLPEASGRSCLLVVALGQSPRLRRGRRR
jgi:SagB-type dehydrogenase family enzyme